MINKIITIGFILMMNVAVMAQKPEKIYGHAKVSKSLEWYQTQSKLWKAELDKNPQNADAWFNYFRVTRILLRKNENDKRTNEEKNAELKKLVAEMEQQIPGSYEFYLSSWILEGDYSKKLYPEMMEKLGDGHTDHYENLLTYYEVSGNIAMRDKYLKKYYHDGQVSTGMLYYNYNVLVGLEENAILLTVGDNDTYPIWVLQNLGIRPDVTVLNTSLLMLDDYRNSMMKKLGVAPLKMQKFFDKSVTQKDITEYEQTLVRNLAANSKKYPVYVALTASGCDNYLDTVSSQLYLTGLAYVYSKETIDNIALLKHHFEHDFALDYIDKAFYYDRSEDLVKLINTNYVIPMLKLYDHYKSAGDANGMETMKRKLVTLCKGTEQEKAVYQHLGLK